MNELENPFMGDYGVEGRAEVHKELDICLGTPGRTGRCGVR